MARIGFIGLGHMGFAMASNLVKAGHTVTAFDLQRKVLDRFANLGGIAARDIKEAGRLQDVIITMLQNGQQVRRVYLGETGLLSIAEKGTLVIDCSSIDVKSARDIHAEALAKELISVDAPVSGGVASAAAGTLTIMVGGSEKAFSDTSPILKCMGTRIIHTGPEGSGQAAKICNNMLVGISMAAVSEAFLLAEQLGVSPQKLFEVVTNASGQCWVMSHYVPVPDLLDNVPANNNYQPGFAANMMLKDLHLSQGAAAMVGVRTPMGQRATALYQQLVDRGMGDLDFSVIIKSISEHLG